MLIVRWCKLLSGCFGMLIALLAYGGTAEAQGVLSFSGQVKSSLPQSTLVEPVAAVARA